MELDGYAVSADFHSHRDFALAYAEQTGNPEARYEVGDFLQCREGGYDFVFLFYPLLLGYQMLLWGLPFRFFAPQRLVDQAAAALRPGAGW